ncbi:MAG: NAD-dependent epimerase/dehydratase family protein [Sphingobacteriales bacterium]|nr:NAD-dependent epimerase/dehydratase family protein [Sphingobacteriales bacterium]MBI3718043.1 NAD-dependent epimerase/dehydratase family protein [Sphingobacteriales bacterium]
MKILIIGSEGFIGSHCVSYFLEKGATVTGVDLTATARAVGYKYIPHTTGAGYNALFAQEQFDVCINASGNGSVPVSISDPVFDFTANCSEPIALLEAIRINNPHCKLIHLSSAAVYGTPATLPVKENSALQPLSPYGWHKLLSEQLCREYVQLYGLPVAVVRPFSVYGPGLRKQLLWDIFQRTKQTDAIELWGTGNESRDFIFINDLVRAFESIFKQAPMIGEVYNLGTGIEISIRKMAGLFCNMLDKNITVLFNGKARPGDPANWCADISKLKELGFEHLTSIEEGLRETAKWIKRQ